MPFICSGVVLRSFLNTFPDLFIISVLLLDPLNPITSIVYFSKANFCSLKRIEGVVDKNSDKANTPASKMITKATQYLYSFKSSKF